jgi:hypothetical protein
MVAFEEPTHGSGLDRIVSVMGRRRNADLSRRRKLSVQTKHVVTSRAPNTLIFVYDVRAPISSSSERGLDAIGISSWRGNRQYLYAEYRSQLG